MDHTQFPINKADLIEGLGKGLRLIEAFDDEHPRMTVSEAAQRTGLTRTAARRYLLSLCHFGWCSPSSSASPTPPARR
jgi:IclR family pca regulon transcriptional regulator